MATSKPSTGGFGFGTSTPAPTTQLSSAFLAAPITEATKPSVGFGTTSTTKPSGFSFGAPASTAAAKAPAGFGFGSSSTTTTPGFGFGGGAPQSQGAFGLSTSTTAPATTQSLPTFGGTPAMSSAASTLTGAGVMLGSQQTASKPTFGIGGFSAATKPAGISLAVPDSTTKSAATGFQLGGLKAPTATAPAPTTTVSGFQLPGAGFKLASASTTTSAAAAPGLLTASNLTKTTAPVPSTGLFSLNQPSLAPTASSTSSTTVSSKPGLGILTQTSVSAPTSASSSATGIKLSTPFTSNSTAIAPASSSSKPAPLAGFSLTTAATSALSSSTASGTATSTAASSSSMTYKDLETKINKWSSELEQQEHLFLTQATQVNAWNKLLIDNSEKITNLNSDFEKVKSDQDRLNQELDFIKTQQQELEDLLLPLEESTRQQAPSLGSSVHTHHADMERERTYNLAENIDAQLKRMVQDLREVIDHVNATSAPSDASNPVNQITKILSAHMDSLQWLDSNSGALQQKLDQLTRQVNERKMEQESRFRLAFD
ncbi:unnamed protein product [Clavelina lepadiformis]|uniref:Nucleoporin NSP1-like C-terminal domain-containing protein n=1 Tax=Clavelina lepadiformis TaxID=159417 RepID=A0ABP0F898_CLALP